MGIEIIMVIILLSIISASLVIISSNSLIFSILVPLTNNLCVLIPYGVQVTKVT